MPGYTSRVGPSKALTARVSYAFIHDCPFVCVCGGFVYDLFITSRDERCAAARKKRCFVLAFESDARRKKKKTPLPTCAALRFSFGDVLEEGCLGSKERREDNPKQELHQVRLTLLLLPLLLRRGGHGEERVSGGGGR